jgi:hypothetical protein
MLVLRSCQPVFTQYHSWLTDIKPVLPVFQLASPALVFIVALLGIVRVSFLIVADHPC